MNRNISKEWQMGVLCIAITLVAVTVWGTNDISSASNTVSAIASIGTLVIALMVYNRFSAAQKLIDRQFDIVNELVIAMNTCNFSFLDIRTKDPLGHYNVSTDTRYHNHVENWTEKKILITPAYVSEMKNIRNLANNLLMPSSIKASLKPICVDTIGLTDGLLMSDYSDEFSVIDCQPAEPPTITDWEVGKLNSEEMIIRDFFDHWQNVRTQIIQWLEENTNTSIDMR